jgi:hypothetical protein
MDAADQARADLAALLQALSDEAAGLFHEVLDSGADFAGWLAAVLGQLSAERGGVWAVLAARPGSWEAALVRDLITGTTGEDY